jgi:pyridoxine kinase
VLDVLKTLRRVAKSKDSTNDSHVRYVCDPVMGDAGKFYVPQELVAIYRDEVIPLADVVTPNQFEVEQLTGIVVKNIADAKRACQSLHSLGPDLVFITSIMLEDDQTSQGEKIENEAESIAIIASRRIHHTPNAEEEYEMWRIDSPIIPGRFTGTGDLCAALLLGHTAMEPGNLPTSMEKVIGTMFSVIKRTSESSIPGSIASMELKLIQSKQDIESPPSLFKARKVL